MRQTVLLLLTALALAGCSQQGTSSGGAQAQTSSGGQGILGRLRPKADPADIQKMHDEQAAALAKQQQEMAAQQAAQQALGQQQPLPDGSTDLTGLGRILPKVSTDPIAPPAEEVAAAGPVITPSESSGSSSGTSNPFSNPMFTAPPVSTPPPPPVATYGAPGGGAVPPPPPGGNLGSGLVPPPPAVTLSTQAQTIAGMPPGDPSNPYANPYMNPYAIPYPQAYPQQAYPGYAPQFQQPAVPQQPSRPSGSPFGSGGASSGGGSSRAASDSDDDPKAAERARKAASFVPITPTGMEARSAYKQRDELKILWKGALTSGSLSGIARDEKYAEELNRVDVSLPNEATKGSFSISQRQVDSFFRTPQMDKKLYPVVRRVEGELVQTYLRYLYAYNKFSLASQTVSARKQEADMANSASEQQRAAADLSQAQSEADSARDDMKAAQTELAGAAGAQAARTIISRVTGVTPSMESLNVADAQPAPQQQQSKGIFGLFGGGGKKDAQQQPQQAAPDQSAAQVAKADRAAQDKKSKVKDKKGKDKGQDLTPSPQVADKSDAPDAAPAQAAPQGDISFELKGVNVTPRKSVLTVAIRNAGANNFSISPDVISISEGNRKLSEASVRADFDTTLVQPNQEVKGTITIFGRPWSDKLAVVLSDGGKSIPMHR